MGDGAALDGLNDEQRAAVEAEARHLCIVAGPGSGKTRVLTRRIAHRARSGALDPRRVLALTFTRKAASELTRRLRALGLRDPVAAGTFHGVALSLLRSRWAEQGRAEPELLTRKVPFVTKVLGRRPPIEVVDLVAEIEWAKARRHGPKGYAAAVAESGRATPGDPTVIADCYRRYEKEKNDRRRVDFDDLLILARRALLEDPQYGDAQRWRFRHLFVDEFQDVNAIQFAFIEALLGDESDLCVVGDPRQAIYGWNGADPALLESFEELFPGAETVQLRRNHRSSPQILAVADAVMVHGSPLVATRGPGPVPVVHDHGDDRAEARGVARAVRDEHGPGRQWRHQAVLTRTNAQLTLFEEALRVAGIPYRTRGGTSLLERADIKALLRTLPLGARLDVVLSDLETEQPADDSDDGSAGASADDRQAAVDQLVRYGHDHLALDGGATLGSFLAWLRAATGGQDEGVGDDAVTLTTFHAAKGLEWPVVHVTGLEDGYCPIHGARTAQERREERNLVYVAVTRAERSLHLSWARRRRLGTREVERSPSPFLVEISAALEVVDAGPAPADARDRVAQQRRLLDAGRGRRIDTVAPVEIDLRDDPVYRALTDWRRVAAHAASVPAHVVFDDRTLAALASSRPRSRRDLETIPGLGPVKLSRYGDALLEVVDAAGAD